METEMVERVARVLCRRAVAAEYPTASAEVLDKMAEDPGEPYLSDASAAIEAMREPTEAMLSAAGPHGTFWDDTCTPKDCWDAMIDASLQKPNA
jgi:hypothetical protein